MKYILLTLISSSLFACTSVKRSTTTYDSKIDSTSFKTKSITQVAKLDSTLKGRDFNNEKKILDSGYSRVTIIREYYSAGTDTAKTHFPNKVKSGKSSAHEAHPGSQRTGRLLYRETTISESGAVKSHDEKTTASTRNISVNKIDSTSAYGSDSTSTSASISAEKRLSDRKGQWPWWVWLIVSGAALYLLYKLYKNIRSRWP